MGLSASSAPQDNLLWGPTDLLHVVGQARVLVQQLLLERRQLGRRQERVVGVYRRVALHRCELTGGFRLGGELRRGSLKSSVGGD